MRRLFPFRAKRRAGAELPAMACLLALLSACAGPTHQAGTCTMLESADLPVLNDRGQPIIRAKVDGQPVAFIVDTGAQRSLLFPKAADRLGLATDMDRHAVMEGVGGSVFAYPVQLRSLDLGTAIAHNVEFLTAGDLGGTVDGLPVVGLFGADFLANYDVEFDLPAHHFALYREHNCADDFPQPWPAATGHGALGQVFSVPFELRNDSQVMVTLNVDGHPVEAQLDSGAGTILDLDAAHEAGATREALDRERLGYTRGIDGNRMPFSLHRFGALEIGPERISPVLLEVGDIPHSLLGANLLRTHKVWISYPHHVLWLQPVRTGFSPRLVRLPAEPQGSAG